jgi:hypothetical protein
MKRIVVSVVRGIAGIAGVVFLVCPLRTWTLVLAFGSAVAVFLICQIVLGSLDETFDDKDTPIGYWPPKPIDWTALPKSRDALDKNVDGTGS